MRVGVLGNILVLPVIPWCCLSRATTPKRWLTELIAMTALSLDFASR